jgi:hypothetical protein
MADIPIIPGVKVATKGILNKPLKDVICAILFGGLNNMLKGNLLCVQADLNALIEEYTDLPSIKDLQDELKNLRDELKAMEDLSDLKDGLARVNAAIAEVQNLLALDGMCKIPLKAPKIPDVIKEVIDAEFAEANAILKDIGRLSKPELCLSGSGGINTGKYNPESILGSIQKHGGKMANIPSQKFANLKKKIQGVTKALSKSVNRQLFPDFRHKHNLITGKTYKAGEPVITLAPPPPLANQWNGSYPPANVSNLKTASANASSLVASLAKTASYPSDVNGIRYQNIWPGLVGPELYGLAVTALTPQDPLFTQQDPIYDYCGKIVGYSSTVITGDAKSGGGDPSVDSEPNPPITDFNFLWIEDRQCWAVDGITSDQIINGRRGIQLNSNPEITLHRGRNHLFVVPSYEMTFQPPPDRDWRQAPEFFICYVDYIDNKLVPRMKNGQVEKFNLGLSRLETYELLEDANGADNPAEAQARKERHPLGTHLYFTAENKVYSGTLAPRNPDSDVWWYNTDTCVAKRWVPDNLDTGAVGYWIEVSDAERAKHWFGSSIIYDNPTVNYLAYSTQDGSVFGLLKLI